MNMRGSIWTLTLRFAKLGQLLGISKNAKLRRIGYRLGVVVRDEVAIRVPTNRGFYLWVDPHSSLCRSLKKTGTYEEGVTRFLERTIKPGDIVVDVGANVGYFTVLMSKLVGENGRVFAFEPERWNYETLLRNVQENCVDNVRCENMAIANFVGRADLSLHPFQTGSHSIIERFPGGLQAPVNVTTLDEYMRGHVRQVDVVKMDIEGAEGLALEGMKDLLQSARRVSILLELNPRLLESVGLSSRWLAKAIVGNGLDLSLLDDRGNSEALDADDVAGLTYQCVILASKDNPQEFTSGDRMTS